jgi:hypothetical protein
MLALDFFQNRFGRELLIGDAKFDGYRLSYAHGKLSATRLDEFETALEESFNGAKLTFGKLPGVCGERR